MSEEKEVDVIDTKTYRGMGSTNPKAVYACLNYGEVYSPDEIKEQSILINGDIREVLSKIK